MGQNLLRLFCIYNIFIQFLSLLLPNLVNHPNHLRRRRHHRRRRRHHHPYRPVHPFLSSYHPFHRHLPYHPFVSSTPPCPYHPAFHHPYPYLLAFRAYRHLLLVAFPFPFHHPCYSYRILPPPRLRRRTGPNRSSLDSFPVPCLVIILAKILPLLYLVSECAFEPIAAILCTSTQTNRLA